MSSIDVQAAFVVAATVLDERVSGTDHRCRAQPFQLHIGRSRTVIGFDEVIRVVFGDVARAVATLRSLAGRPCTVGIYLGGAWQCSRAWVKNRRVVARSRFWNTSTSMAWPYWSIADTDIHPPPVDLLHLSCTN